MSVTDTEPTSPPPAPAFGSSPLPGSVPRSPPSLSDEDGDDCRLGMIASYHGMPSPTGSAMSPALDTNAAKARVVYPRDVVDVAPAAAGDDDDCADPGRADHHQHRHAVVAARRLRLEDQRAVEAACNAGRTNPLAYDWSQHAGVLQCLKMVLIGLFLFIPRVLLFGLGCATLAVGARIRRAGYTDDELEALPIPHRGPGLALMRGGARIVLFSVGYVWISVDDQRSEDDKKKGDGGNDEEAPVVVANHYGFFDAFFFGALNAPTPVSKYELLQAPFAGGLLKALQTIGVKRESADGRRQVAHEIHRRSKWRVEQSEAVLAEHPSWAPLLIFPEATNTNCRTMLEFKPGPFLPLAPVQPVTIDPRQNHLDVSWTGDCDVPLTLLRMMCQLYNKLHVTYLPVMRPVAAASPDGGVEDPVAFCERTRVAMAAHLGVPLSGHNVTDLFLQVKDVERLGIPLDEVNVEMGAYPIPTAPPDQRRQSALNHVRRRLHLFAAFDAVDPPRVTTRDGRLFEAEFAQLLRYQPTSLASSPPNDADADRAMSVIACAVARRLRAMRRRQEDAGEEEEEVAIEVPTCKDGDAATRSCDIDFRGFVIMSEALFPLLDCIPLSDPVCAATIAPPKPGGAAERRRRRSSVALDADAAGSGSPAMTWAFVAPELEPDGDTALYGDCLSRLAAALEDWAHRQVEAPPTANVAVAEAPLAGHTQAERDALATLYRSFLLSSSRRHGQSSEEEEEAPAAVTGSTVAREFCEAYPVLNGAFFAARAFGNQARRLSAATGRDREGVEMEDL